MSKSQASATEIERLIFHMPTVAGDTQETWARGFAQSIMRQSRRKNWMPSVKQVSLMQKLVADLFSFSDEGEFDLIERGDLDGA